MSRSFFLGSLWVTEFPNETRMALFCFKPLSVTRNQRRNAIDHQVGNNSSLQAAWSGRSQSDAVRHSWNGPKKPWWGIIQMDWAQRFYIYVNESKRKMIFRECQNSFIKKCNNIFFCCFFILIQEKSDKMKSSYSIHTKSMRAYFFREHFIYYAHFPKVFS